MTDTISIRHEPGHRRFVATIGESPGEAVLEYRPRDERTLEYYHTFTPRGLRGRGIAGQLVAFALDYASEHDYRIVPTCPFVAKAIEDEPRYAELVGGGNRGA